MSSRTCVYRSVALAVQAHTVSGYIYLYFSVDFVAVVVLVSVLPAVVEESV